jgi:hypothetical protein
MIVKIDHDTGAVIETSMGLDGGLPPVEIARVLLTVLPGETRVRVWEDGLSFLDPPSADETRDATDRLKPVDEALREAREALAARLADSLGGALEGLGPASEPSKWEHCSSGASQLIATAQQSGSGDFLPPV